MFVVVVLVESENEEFMEQSARGYNLIIFVSNVTKKKEKTKVTNANEIAKK